MTQEEKKYLGKIKLWFILHPDYPIKPFAGLCSYCPYYREPCHSLTLIINKGFSECKITEYTGDIESEYWGCVEWIRTPKKT